MKNGAHGGEPSLLGQTFFIDEVLIWNQQSPNKTPTLQPFY